MAMNTEACIDACNQLLRGELSAIETYGQALEKFTDSGDLITLGRLRETHIRHAETLRRHVVSMGGTPSGDSGAWGAFAQAIEGTAKLLGESPALQALVAGEEHGADEYEEALQDDDVMGEIKSAIQSELLPDQRQNVQTLKQLQRTT
jgi:rubrerythrin